MSLYHSGSRPEIQSKDTAVMPKANMNMNRGAKRLAFRLKAGSFVSSCLREPRTKMASATSQRTRKRMTRAEKKGKPSQSAFPARTLL